MGRWHLRRQMTEGSLPLRHYPSVTRFASATSPNALTRIWEGSERNCEESLTPLGAPALDGAQDHFLFAAA
jgi:hypothetical protein